MPEKRKGRKEPPRKPWPKRAHRVKIRTRHRFILTDSDFGQVLGRNDDVPFKAPSARRSIPPVRTHLFALAPGGFGPVALLPSEAGSSAPIPGANLVLAMGKI